MNMPRVQAIGTIALAALFSPALFALDLQNAPAPNSAVPGTLNYVEGSATLNGQPVGQRAIGQATVAPGQTIATTEGHAEVLLTPGVFFRLGNNSAAQMVSPNLTNTVVDVERGRATVEVDQLFKENEIHIVEDNVPVQLIKPGLYEFDADRGSVVVFKGEAAVPRGNGKWVTVKDGHNLNIAEGANANLKTAKFDADQAEQSDLYKWSSLRSDYLAEANQQIAGEYGAGYAPGWYWDPWMYDYTFLGPYPFYSPFGWGFYPFGWGGYYGGFYGHGFYRGGFRGGDFGGFHGGGFGGGFHGGGFRGGR